MDSKSLWKKWDELLTLRMEKEVKLEVYIQKWLDGERTISYAALVKLINSTNEQIEDLKASEATAMEEYLVSLRKELLIENGLSFCDKPVLQVTGEEMASYSFNLADITDETRSYDEIELEKESALAHIRYLTAIRQISLDEATKLNEVICSSYEKLLSSKSSIK